MTDTDIQKVAGKGANWKTPDPSSRLDLHEFERLADRAEGYALRVDPLRGAGLAREASRLAGRTIELLVEPLLELSPRRPYVEGRGGIDVYRPGRWDTTYDLIYMSPIVTGPNPGEWNGSVVYGDFTPLAPGTHLIIASFTGYQITLALNGPWGTVSVYTGTTADPGTAAAVWNGGDRIFFTSTCKGTGSGYLSSIRVFAL
jgi:hypothetical protein